MATAPELLRKITEHAERGCGLVISLSEAEFIDSHIVHTMVKGDQLLRKQHRRLVLHVGTPRIVERILELSGLLDELIWSDALDKAVALAEQQL